MFCVHVNDSNVMGVIERKPPSSFSRRSPSGNSGFERFHPPPLSMRSFLFASHTLINSPSTQPCSFLLVHPFPLVSSPSSFIPFALSLFLLL